jgi:hypothetical protein
MNFSTVLAQSLEVQIVGLLTRVAQDYNLNHGELISKYLTVSPSALPPAAPVQVADGTKKKRQIKEKPGANMCEGKTAKGDPCKFVAKPGECLCGIHLRKLAQGGGEEAPKVPKVTKVKAKKPEAPKHTHALNEEPEEPCVVCETQGDVLKPEMTSTQFEVEGESIQDRLKAILADADDDTEEPVAEPVVEPVAEPVVEPEEEEDAEDIRSKLLNLIRDENSDAEDDATEQMCETPPSRDKLAEMMEKMNIGKNSNGGMNFDALLEEMEEDEE